MEYRYRVEFAHLNEAAEDVSGGIHHGMGTIEIATEVPIETQQQKDDVATVIGRKLHKEHNITDVAIQSIIPLETGHVVIDASNDGVDE